MQRLVIRGKKSLGLCGINGDFWSSNSASRRKPDACWKRLPRLPREFAARPLPLACIYTAQRRFREALPLWQQAALQDPQESLGLVWPGGLLFPINSTRHAAACYGACIALKPDFHGWYFQRSVAYLQRNEYALAVGDFDVVIHLRPDGAEARVNRALARLGENRCRHHW